MVAYSIAPRHVIRCFPMKLRLIAIAFMLCAAAAAQSRHKLVINAQTPEGSLLQQIGQESDPAKKRALIEEFLSKYPKHEGVSWAEGQAQETYLKANEYDRAITAGEHVLAADPGDLDAAYNNLKAAEGKKDADLIGKWSAQTSEIARKIAGSTKDTEEDAKQRIDYAKQVDTYTEYALYAAALQQTDPRKIILLGTALEQRNPNGQYLQKVAATYLNAVRQVEGNDKAGLAAERIAAHEAPSEDALLMAADHAMRTKAPPDKVIGYATKLIDTLTNKPKAEGMSDSDWEKKKTTMLGLANWMAGMSYGAQNKLPQADKSLRAALPYIKGNEQLLGPALFQLGLVDYKMGTGGKSRAMLQDALKFNEQCAAVRGPMQAQAAKNIRVIRTELGLK